MEYFTVDEIIWAKIGGYPWWPAMIKGIEEDNKEIKYRVSFIGDNTHATLPKRNLNKFEKEYKIHSNTKKKNLLDSIKIAKELYDCKKGLKENNLKENLIDDINKNNNEKIEESALSEKSSNFKDNTFLKKKLKRIDEKNGLDIAHKITNYLASIVIQIKKKKFVIENEKNYMIKVMKFLKDFKMNEPIDYLRKGSLGKIIKFINENISDEEVKNLSYEVYKCFEEQVLNQLFRKKQ